jgi:hypothetical protein
MISHSFDPSLVRPLATAGNQFLQVLVDRFLIRRKGKGFELRVAFNDESPGIWLRAAKRHILGTLPFERRAGLQQRIDAFFGSNEEVYDYHDPSFPFRLGNGGTLPVVHLKGTDYYCLFYRDSHPTGWNIANGGANTRHDLLHPDLIVERELREELIIVEPEPKQGRWYVFDWHDARLRDHPDFALAHDLWEEHFRRQGFREFMDVPLPLKWSLPPDADLEERNHDAIRISYGSEPSVVTGQGFLNLNADDFGIEFDRIAKLSVGPKAVFCDGELRGRKLLNRVVGLFAVNRVQDLLAKGEHHFLPDRIFWDGEDRTGDDPVVVIEAFLQRRGSSWAQLEETLRKDAAPNPPGDPLDLCPVTRTIVGRHRRLREAEPPARLAQTVGGPFEVFISFASEDLEHARTVRDHVAATHRTFFSDVTMTSGAFADQIDHALDSAWAFVAVGSRVEHLNKSWVKYEWRNFHNDTKSGRKPEKSPFFAFVSNIDPIDLPRPLREQTAVTFDAADPTPALAQLSKFIVKP